MKVEEIKNGKRMLDAFEIRRKVFVVEQEVSAAEEYDEFEDSSIHAVLGPYQKCALAFVRVRVQVRARLCVCACVCVCVFWGGAQCIHVQGASGL